MTEKTKPEEMKLPKGFQTDGERVIEHLSTLIEGMPVITVVSALTATLYSAATLEQLEQPAREALAVMIYDLAQNVMRANGISEERMTELMAERSAGYVVTGQDDEPDR